MKKPPYIGVTGFMTPQDVRAALRCFGDFSSRKLMVGVLASSKTLSGMQNKYPNRYPKVGCISDIFQDNPNALNLIHYSTDTPSRLAWELWRLAEICGPHLHGFQLNVQWPDAAELARFHFMTNGKYRLVLQIGDRALAEVENDPRKCADKVAAYVNLMEVIDDILIDASGGKGQALDIPKAREYLQELARRDLNINLGVAGRLCADTFYPVVQLLEEFPDLNVDAEKELRDPISDDLDIVNMNAYIEKAQLWTLPTPLSL